MITEDRLVRLRLAAAFDQQGAQQVGGLRLQRADPFFPPFAMQADLRGVSNRRSATHKGDDFPDAGTWSATGWSWTGARWRLVGAEAVLKLRALRASGDFDAYWDFRGENHAERYIDTGSYDARVADPIFTALSAAAPCFLYSPTR